MHFGCLAICNGQRGCALIQHDTVWDLHGPLGQLEVSQVGSVRRELGNPGVAIAIGYKNVSFEADCDLQQALFMEEFSRCCPCNIQKERRA